MNSLRTFSDFGPVKARSVKLAAVSIFWAAVGMAQTLPYAEFQYSTLTGSGDTISAAHIPIVTATGTIYVDMTLQFNVDSTGKLTVASGYPQFIASPKLTVSSFRAGKYTQAGTSQTANVAGPGVTAGGATEWSLAGLNTYPYTATWYVGPITSNPIHARLQKAGITSTTMSYGIAGGTSIGYTWSNDAILGLSQVANTITISSFSDVTGDHSSPVAQMTFTLTP